MNRKKRLIVLILFTIAVIISACDEESVPRPPLTVAVNLTTPQSPTQAPTINPSQTLVPIPSMTPELVVQRETPTVAQAPTPEPTSTTELTPTPIEPFTIREPSLPIINDYLVSIVSEEFPFITPLTEIAELLYEDVNGDNEDDLVISDYLRVIILLWDENKYSQPFMLTRMPPWKYAPASRVKFTDFTADKVPEVIFDHYDPIGGVGLYHGDWNRYIIHCGNQECKTVWEGTLAGETSDFNAGGMDLFIGVLRLDTTAERPTLRYLTENFLIYSYGMYLPISNHLYFHRAEFEYLTVFTSTLSIYEWNNSTFEFQSEEIVSLPRQIQSAANLVAQNESGNVAAIKITEVDYPISQNDRCELFVDDVLIGEMFGCKYNFTTVEWKDITQDGRDEIIVTTLSGTSDPENLFEIEANCFHQHLIAFTWDGENAEEIINTYGCVVQQDLFGVRFEDFDSDGQDEIIAARWHTEEDCAPIQSEVINFTLFCFGDWDYDLWIYKWNGSRFVYWDSVFGSVLSD